ncbi:MAG: type II toxin-antitoxin system RelE/ParE family toxin [Desulfuromonadales bacterium]|nr:type II toxin-antitoxin system RelE/ParE family toxin [Desulfuromonadales bacterium]
MRPQSAISIFIGGKRFKAFPSHMRELRIQHQGRPLRVLYAFDPGRSAILLVGGDKTGNNRWYKTHVPIADRLYDEYLDETKQGR